jgi:hypothetical protein
MGEGFHGVKISRGKQTTEDGRQKTILDFGLRIGDLARQRAKSIGSRGISQESEGMNEIME